MMPRVDDGKDEKRVRQACMNCRRKKSKCPGERPQCSMCSRLSQTCSYAPFENGSRKRQRAGTEELGVLPQDDVARRFGTIEQKLEELAASVKSTPTFTPTSTTNIYSNLNTTGDLAHAPAVTKSPEPTSEQHAAWTNVHPVFGDHRLDSLSPDVIEDGVRTYFDHFHAQPYTLLCQTDTLKSIALISPIVLNPMLALSIRCSSHPFWLDRATIASWVRALSEKAWRNLMHLYEDGDTGLQYLQGLCLLAQVDFAEGQVRRAHSQIALGIRIAQSSGFLIDAPPIDTTTEEIVRCTWTLFMLDRTFSITRIISPVLPYQQWQLRKPISEAFCSRDGERQVASPSGPLNNDQDLKALFIGVFSIWDDVIKYVFGTAPDDTMPPWQPGSELATIEYRFADFETEFFLHRYREVDFPRRAIDKPHLKPYYASWLCFQLTYMSIQCCCHHPFITFIKLRHVIRKVPPSFLQKSYKSSLIHSRWIIRFLDEMDEAGIMLYDPFIGFLVAIAATIQLEHTLSKHSDIAAAAKLSFRNAIRFLRKLARHWISIQELVEVVEELAARLRHRHTLYYSQDDYDGILPEVETERVGLAEDDSALMWKVFDYASVSASRNNRGSIMRTKSNMQDQAEHERGVAHSHSTVDGNLLNQTNAPHPPEFHTIQPLEDNQDMANLALFDQVPEDWAFTIDDWTLFGAPGSTYFPYEGP